MSKRLIIAFVVCLFPVAHSSVVVEQQGLLLGQALEELARDMGLKMSNKLDEETRARALPDNVKGDAYSLLNKLSEIYNFDWHIYGSILKVESGSDYMNFAFRLKNISDVDLAREFGRYFKHSKKMKFSVMDKGSSVMFSGTRDFIGDSVSFARMIDKNKFIRSGNRLEVEVIKLHHISAASRTITSFGETIVFPGAQAIIEAVLSNIGQFENLGTRDAAKAAQQLAVSQKEKLVLEGGEQTNKVQVIQDSNSLVIRGTPEEINLAKKIVSFMDIQKVAIVFHVRVYDVSVDQTREIGLDSSWLKGEKGLYEIIVPPFQGSKDFFKNFKALYSNGMARSVYETNIMALENYEGQFGKKDSAYFKVESKKEPKLEKVEADNSLYVTGRMLPSGDVRANIKYVEESLSESISEAAPRVGTQSVNSEINIRKDETIVLGGFEKTETLTKEFGVPVLSSIPIIGKLFKSKSIDKKRYKRYISVSFSVVT
ncbi:MAG: hypothetical protein OXC07_09725 [Kistimonas sp.]|nr:hypothetical protein [Kistimonas sp.]